MYDLELGPLRAGVIGAGRLGRAMAHGLQAQGLEVVAASSRSAQGRQRAARELDVPVFDDPVDVLPGCDLVLLCVPDDELPVVARRLAAVLADAGGGQAPRVPGARLASPAAASGTADSSPLRVVHCSGRQPLDVLAPLREQGCDVLSVHPLQTVTDRSPRTVLTGAAAAVTAHDAAGSAFGHALAHALDMHPFDLGDDARPLYHAAATFAANFTVTLQGAVRDLARHAGMHEGVARNAFCALARAAIDRVEQDGPEHALTGPIARGDLGTVAAHLDALDEHLPGHASTYRALAAATTRLAVAAGQLPLEQAVQVDELVATTGRSRRNAHD